MKSAIDENGMEGRCIIARVGMQGGGRGWPPDQSAPRAAPSLSAPIDFYYKNFARGFFLFPAHRKPGDAHKEIRIIRLYELTNAIDFYNEATKLTREPAQAVSSSYEEESR